MKFMRSGTFFAGSIFLATMFAAWPARAEETPAICGDVNANGSVTSSDALAVLRKSVGQDLALACLDHVDRYGTVTDLNTTSYYEPNFLLGRRITIARPATVTAMGVISREEDGGNFRLALYRDANGEPGELVVATTPAKLKVGSQEVAVTPTPVAAGDYWMMGNYEVATYVAVNDFATPTSDHLVKYRALPFGNALPDPFGAASTYGETELNYWVKVTQ
jgi:hypothetical protein